MEGRCKTCGFQVWAGARPLIHELVICPSCFTDNSAPLTAQERAQDWRRRVDKRMRLTGEPFDVAAVIVPYGLDRERAYGAEVERMKARRAAAQSEDRNESQHNGQGASDAVLVRA